MQHTAVMLLLFNTDCYSIFCISDDREIFLPSRFIIFLRTHVTFTLFLLTFSFSLAPGALSSSLTAILPSQKILFSVLNYHFIDECQPRESPRVYVVVCNSRSNYRFMTTALKESPGRKSVILMNNSFGIGIFTFYIIIIKIEGNFHQHLMSCGK